MVRGDAGPGKFGLSAPPAAKVALGGCNRYTRCAYPYDGPLEDEATPRCISDRQRPDRDGPRTNPGNHRVWGQYQREPDGEPRHRVRHAAAGFRKLARPRET